MATKKITKKNIQKHKNDLIEEDNNNFMDYKETTPLPFNWNETIENEPKKFISVLDFNREEIKKLEEKKVLDLSTEDLIKIVIRRGEIEKNPPISRGVSKVLQQINLETIGKSDKARRGRFRGHTRFSRNNNRGKRGRGRGRDNLSSRVDDMI